MLFWIAIEYYYVLIYPIFIQSDLSGNAGYMMRKLFVLSPTPHNFDLWDTIVQYYNKTM